MLECACRRPQHFHYGKAREELLETAEIRDCCARGRAHSGVMKVVGLTGGIGTGKSTCSDLLRARGISVIDTDELARQVVQPGQPALVEVRQAFGDSIIDGKGELRRAELARIAFQDQEGRRKLEQILHPRIRELWRAQVETWRGENHRLAVVVIPLLFETGAEQELDATICIGCSTRTQLSRLASRGWSSEHLQQRLAAQLPLETKVARASFVIWNDAGLDVLSAQLDRILAMLTRDS